jgi:hypothetical protein
VRLSLLLSSYCPSCRRSPALYHSIRLVRIFSEDKNAVLLEQKGAREVWDAGEGEVEMGEGEDDE